MQRGLVPIVACSELADAPSLVVRFAAAPDGLPWLLRVDRSKELQTLFRAVCSVFGVSDRAELPARVRDAVEHNVAAGLMGVHDAELTPGTSRAVYVSRRTARELLGPTLLQQLLAPTRAPGPSRRSPPSPPSLDDESMEVSTVAAIALLRGEDEVVKTFERSVAERKTTRRLLIGLERGQAYTGAVADASRVLRVPRAPYRPLVEERLTAFGDVVAVITSTAKTVRAPLRDREAVADAIARVQRDRYGGQLGFEVPRAGVLARLADFADALARLHARELVHADLSPANVLFTGATPEVFDSLDVPVGMPSTTATFSWAAPEQIIGQPVDPRTDVFALGKLATRLLGGVPFGEQSHYVVPTGGSASRTVEILKCEGVFVDSDHYGGRGGGGGGGGDARAWQVAWQEFLGSCLAYDRGARPMGASAFADGLRSLLERHPPAGALSIAGGFGELVPLERDGTITAARLCSD